MDSQPIDDIDDGPAYGHACIKADPVSVARLVLATDRLLAAQRSTVFNHLTDRLELISSKNIYLWASLSNECLLFLPANYTEILLKISLEIDQDIHWIEVYEPMAVRIFAAVKRGEFVSQILDPEK